MPCHGKGFFVIVKARISGIVRSIIAGATRLGYQPEATVT